MTDEQKTFACPRCKEEATERFYGPCHACRLELRVDAAHYQFAEIPIRRWSLSANDWQWYLSDGTVVSDPGGG